MNNNTVTIEVGYYCTHGDVEGHTLTTVNVHPYLFKCVVICFGFFINYKFCVCIYVLAAINIKSV